MDSPRKVLLVGGYDVNARIDLIKSLRTEYIMMAAGSSYEIEDAFANEGIDYFVYPPLHNVNIFQNVRSMLSLYRLLRTLKPDIVHTFDTKPNVWARLTARLARVPIVVGTVAGLGVLYTNNRWSTKVVRTLYEMLQKSSSCMSDATIFQNQDDYAQFIGGGIVKEENAHVILGSGIATNYFANHNVSENAKGLLKQEFGFDENTLVVCMISRLIRSKGIMAYVQAAETIAKKNPHVRFILVGGYNKSATDSLSGNELARLQSSIIWTGERHDIRELLSISHIFVLPSAYREGIPRVLLEAASMELPLVSTDSPGCREVVIDGYNGYRVPVNNVDELTSKIEFLVCDSVLRTELGQNSRKTVAQLFDLSLVSKQVNQLYKHLLKKTPRHPNKQWLNPSVEEINTHLL